MSKITLIPIRKTEECSICLTRLRGKKEAIETNCGHFYHTKCLMKWLKMSSSCPECRTEVLRIRDVVINNIPVSPIRRVK